MDCGLLTVIDPDRLKRVHLHNVRAKIVSKGKGLEEIVATIILADERGKECGQMDWSQWINGGCEALRKGEW
jgi:hypothetical protein